MTNSYKIFFSIFLIIITLLQINVIELFGNTEGHNEVANKELVDSLNLLSYNNRRSNPKLSLEHAIKAHMACKELEYDKGLAFAIHNMGTAKAVLGRYDIGLLDLIEASRIREEIEDHVGLVSTYNNIGFVFSEMGNDNKALEFYEKALLFQQKTDKKQDVGIVLNNIGHVHFRNNNYDQALTFFYQALAINEEDGDERGASASRSNIGTVYRSMGEYEKGLEYHYEAYKIGQKYNDKYGIISTLRSIAEDYMYMNQLVNATNYALRSLLLAKDIGSLGEEKNTAGLLAIIYEKRGKYKETAQYLKMESNLKDSLFNIEKAEVIGRMQAAYELESKAKENEFLRKEQTINAQRIKMQRYLLYFSTAFLIIAGVLIITIFISQKRVNIANKQLLLKNKEIIKQKETIQQKAEALDEKNNELQKINQIKDKLISVIAHDLKNPFNGIAGYSEVMISRIDSYSQSELLSFIRIINDNAIKGNMLLDNLLQWSRLQTHTLQFIPTEQNLYKLVNDELFFIQHVANEKKIQIFLNIPQNLTIFADSNMLKTVFRNLISNALKFTRHGGTISVSAEKKEDGVQLSVNDTGVGIDPKIKDKLFTGEVGVTTPNESGEKGSGLGLMLCKDFVDMHKGRIWVESTTGQGAKFHFFLPNRSEA